MLHTLFSRRAVLNIEPIIQEKVAPPRFISVVILTVVLGQKIGIPSSGMP